MTLYRVMLPIIVINELDPVQNGEMFHLCPGNPQESHDQQGVTTSRVFYFTPIVLRQIPGGTVI